MSRTKLRLKRRAMKGQIDCAFRVPFVAAPVQALESCAERFTLSQTGVSQVKSSTFHEGLVLAIGLRVSGLRFEGSCDPKQTALRQIMLVRWLLVVCNAVEADARLMYE
jgi:hypothetical protein